MKYYKSLIVVLVLAFVLAGCASQTNPSDPSTTNTAVPDNSNNNQALDQSTPNEDQTGLSYQDISVAEAKSLIDENPDLIIIDVSPRYDEGHLPGAINYYVGDGSLDKAIPGLDKEAMYLVYCHVDSASILGAEKLIEAGFTNVYRLEGNYSAWVEAGYEVER